MVGLYKQSPSIAMNYSTAEKRDFSYRNKRADTGSSFTLTLPLRLDYHSFPLAYWQKGSERQILITGYFILIRIEIKMEMKFKITAKTNRNTGRLFVILKRISLSIFFIIGPKPAATAMAIINTNLPFSEPN